MERKGGQVPWGQRPERVVEAERAGSREPLSVLRHSWNVKRRSGFGLRLRRARALVFGPLLDFCIPSIRWVHFAVN